MVPPGVSITLAEGAQVEPKCLLKRSIVGVSDRQGTMMRFHPGVGDQQQQEHEQQQVGQDVVPPGVKTTLAEAEQVEPKCLLKRSFGRRPSAAGRAAWVMLRLPSLYTRDRTTAPPQRCLHWLRPSTFQTCAGHASCQGPCRPRSVLSEGIPLFGIPADHPRGRLAERGVTVHVEANRGATPYRELVHFPSRRQESARLV